MLWLNIILRHYLVAMTTKVNQQMENNPDPLKYNKSVLNYTESFIYTYWLIY